MSVPELKADPATGIIYMHWTEPGAHGKRGRSKRKSTGTSSMDAAKAYLGEWLLMERASPGDDGAALTIQDLWMVYQAKHIDVKTASRQTARFTWLNLRKHFADLTPAAIDQDVVDAYEKRRAKGAIGKPSKPATVRRELLMLLACIRWCAEPKRKMLSPALIPIFDLPAESEPRDRWLKMEEMKRLLTAAAELRRGARLSRGERFLWLALETAARKRAILQLTWDRVDFETGVIRYDVPGRVKTKKRRANVPISTALRPVLERAYAERIGDLVMDNEAEMWATVQWIAIEAGFGAPQKVEHTKKPKKTGVSPHVLRHTAATHMARRGVPLWTIAGILGNTVAMVEKVYGHHCPDGLRGGVEQISAGVLGVAI